MTSAELAALSTGDALTLAPLPPDAAEPARPPRRPPPAALDPAPQRRGSTLGSYLAGLGRGLLLLFQPGNAFTVLFLMALLSLQAIAQYAMCFALPMIVILNGWYMAYLLQVVIAGAAGDDDLPGLAFGSDSIEGILAPLLKTFAAYLAASAPMVAACIYAAVAGLCTPVEGLGLWASALAFHFSTLELLSPKLLAIVLPAWLMTYLLQPMVLLCVAVGGLGTLHRLDQMVRTIVETLPGYLLLVGFYFGVLALSAGFQFGLDLGMQGADELTTLLGSALSFAAPAPFMVWAMYGIGLHYHHFKQRYAWSWG